MRLPLQKSLFASLFLTILLAVIAGYFVTSHPLESASAAGGSPFQTVSEQSSRQPRPNSTLTLTTTDPMAPRYEYANPSDPRMFPPPSNEVSPTAGQHQPSLINTNPTAPGNSFVMNGSRIKIEATASPGGGFVVDVLITPPQVNITSSPLADSREYGGLTRDQKAFRAKWGWAAFDQAQRAAKGYDR